jgi:hypothetical protein
MSGPAFGVNAADIRPSFRAAPDFRDCRRRSRRRNGLDAYAPARPICGVSAPARYAAFGNDGARAKSNRIASSFVN